MDYILERYKKYGIEYKNKIITIKQEMPVSVFLEMKYLLSRVIDEVKDIRVETYRAYY